jgi:hypothetical protein
VTVDDVKKLRRLLAQIAKLAEEAASNGPAEDGDDEDDGRGGGSGKEVPGCSIKSVPARLLEKAAKNAVAHNPVNAPLAAGLGGDTGLGVLDPLQIAVLTAKYWGPTPRRLTVSFMDGGSAELRRKVLQHMNAWTKTACVSFAETAGTGQVRITRGESGYWSYLGTDILLIPTNRPTMCLQDFSTNTPDSEFYRVVRHETGHTLGFPHEHMRKELIARINRKKAYDYFQTTQGWDKAMVDAQVLTPLDDRQIMGTPADQDSIMCYQLPGSITKDGKPIRGGTDINATDYAFAGRIYPRPGAATAAAPVRGAAGAGGDDWGEEEDVELGE